MQTIHPWAVQDAKSHFSEIVKKAAQEGPQFISVRGRLAVVMISQTTYQQLISPKKSLFELLRQSPIAGMSIKLIRDKSLPRDIEL